MLSGKVVTAFETGSWRGILKIKWIERITNGEVFFKGRKKKDNFQNIKK